MKFLRLTFFLLLVIAVPVRVPGQNIAAVSPTASAAPKGNPKPAAAKTSASPGNKPKGLDFNAGVTGPITTEIYADEAFFDSNKSEGIFRGRVKVNDPRFNLQADKLTVFISKSALQSQNQSQGQTPAPTPTPSPNQKEGQSQPPTQGQGLEKAIAEGNVAVVKERPDPNGGPPSHTVGRADTAIYTASTGDVELKGSPRVQQGLNTHIATSPDTVMLINQSGQLTTRGPSRTDIRQEPKELGSSPAKDDNKTPSASPKPAASAKP